MSENQSKILQQQINAGNPSDDRERQGHFARMIREQGRPHFIVWWHTYDRNTGQDVTVLQEAEVLMSDWSVLQIELHTNKSSQAVNACEARANNIKTFTQRALSSDSAARCDDDFSFEGQWYAALDELSPGWAEQAMTELFLEAVDPTEQEQVATH